MPTAFASFRFAIVGFTLPYMFVYRPELLMLSPDGEPAGWLAMMLPVAAATLGVTCFAAGIAGQLRHPPGSRSAPCGVRCGGPSCWLQDPQSPLVQSRWPIFDLAGVVVFGLIVLLNRPR